MNNHEQALKSCPLCGCCGVRFTTTDQNRHSIKCEDCPCGAEFYSSTKEQAIDAWNRRATLQPTEQPEAAQDERERFEKWYDQKFIKPGHAKHHRYNGSYCTQELSASWKAWQAAKRDAAQAPQERAADISESLRMLDNAIPYRLTLIRRGECVDASVASIQSAISTVRDALLSLSAQSSEQRG